jgi:hypothetical protein
MGGFTFGVAEMIGKQARWSFSEDARLRNRRRSEE